MLKKLVLPKLKFPPFFFLCAPMTVKVLVTFSSPLRRFTWEKESDQMLLQWKHAVVMHSNILKEEENQNMSPCCSCDVIQLDFKQ